MRRRLPLLWLVLLFIAAILLPGRIWIMLLLGLGGLFLASFIWVWALSKGLSGRRQLRFGWVAVGDRLSENFEISNDSLLPALWVEIVDHSNVPGYRAAVVRSVGAGTTERWRQSAVCRQRGMFRLGPWRLQSADPFGIFRVVVDYQQAEEIIIHPPIHADIPVPLPAGQSSGRARARERSWQATINAASVREYRPDDPRHIIHWPTTARRDQLFVREFDLDAAGDIWLLLDLEAAAQLGRGADGTEEHSVLLAAALLARALRQNRPVGLAGYGREPQLIPPGRGQGQQWRLLRALALAQADGESGLARALRDAGRVARRGSAAVIITPSGRVDWLPEMLRLVQSGIRCSAILLDRASFDSAAAPASQSQGLREAVRQLGIDSYLVQQGELGRPVEEETARGFWEFKVTALGKVVTVRTPYDS